MSTIAITYVGDQNTPGGLPTFQGIPCSATFSVQGGTGPYTWSVSAGALPAGVDLSTFSGGESVQCVISGIPTTLGAFSYTILVQDSSHIMQFTSLAFSGLIIASGLSYAGMTLQAQPGFAEILLAALAYGLPLTAAVLKALNSAVQFAAARTEYFYAYYSDGMTVGLPVSPIDGYPYAREELRYIWSICWTASANWSGAGSNNLLVGPATGPTTGTGQLLQCGYLVDPDRKSVV